MDMEELASWGTAHFTPEASAEASEQIYTFYQKLCSLPE
jgi:hypothetical protein